MPADIEVILGWSFKDFCKLFGFKLPSSDEDYWEEIEKIHQDISIKQLNKKLRKAHLDALLDANIIIGKYKYKSGFLSHLLAQTKAGNREFSIWDIGIFGDEGELGNEYPNDYIAGIQLSARYFPIYLDYKDSHGTIPHFDYEDMKPLIDIAKKHLIKVDGRFKEAHIFVKLIWY